MLFIMFSENVFWKVYILMMFVFIFFCSIMRCYMDLMWRCINRFVILCDNVIESGFVSDGFYNVNFF